MKRLPLICDRCGREKDTGLLTPCAKCSAKTQTAAAEGGHRAGGTQ